MGPKCELCHGLAATMVCEECEAKVCSVCCDCIMNDPEDISTWVILCDECIAKLDEPVYEDEE